MVPSFGEWPRVLGETLSSFENAVCKSTEVHYPFELKPPLQWSNHFRNALTDDWKTTERAYQSHNGWTVLSTGEVTAPVIVANLNTLISLAGTKYFPEVTTGRILLLEEQDALANEEERRFRHLQLMGVFDKISGLIIGRPEKIDLKAAPFDYHQLILEIVGPREYPIIGEFDCGHIHPMLTLAQGVSMTLCAQRNSHGGGGNVTVIINEEMIS